MWIKICGIRDVETARAVAAAGPDAIGLNFYRGSPRVVTRDVARAIVRALPAGIDPVGVFVNATPSDIRDMVGDCGLKTIQLHGDEPPVQIAELAPLRVIRAFRVGAEGLDGVGEYLEECRKLGTLPAACLVDSRVEGTFGGTGVAAPWEIVRAGYRAADWPSLVLAGGLTPANVAAAIAAVRPYGVDVAGGVESAVACKDLALVRKFVEAARAAGST